MSYKRYTRLKKEKTMQSQAAKVSSHHSDEMKGKRTILIPHPTIPKTYIEKIIKE